MLLPILTYSMVQGPSREANWFAARQKFPRISQNPKVNYRTQIRPPPVSILGQPSPVPIATSHLLEIHPNIIHPSTPRSLVWSPSLQFTLLLTYSTVQSPSWEANWFAVSKEIPCISRNPKDHYCTHKRPPPVSILGQPNPVHIPTTHLLEIHPNIIHTSTLKSPQWSPSLRFTHLLTYSIVQSPSWEANWSAASQEIPRISRNPKVHYRTHKRPPPISILGQHNPVHIPKSHVLEMNLNIIHPSTPRSPQWAPSLQFPHQDPIHPPLLTVRATCPAHLILIDFITRTILGEQYKEPLIQINTFSGTKVQHTTGP